MARHPALTVALREEIEETCLDLANGKPLAEVAGLTWRRPDGRAVRNPSRGFTRDLDALPFPARHLTRNQLYVRPDTGAPQTTLVTNRGCPHRCTYCLANQVAGLANRYRSVENVLAEIRECVERHGISSFLFRSDLFTQDKRWVRRLCEAILDGGLAISWACNSRVDTVDAETLRWMKRAGCWIAAFGVESGDQSALDRLEKNATVGRGPSRRRALPRGRHQIQRVSIDGLAVGHPRVAGGADRVRDRARSRHRRVLLSLSVSRHAVATPMRRARPPGAGARSRSNPTPTRRSRRRPSAGKSWRPIARRRCGASILRPRKIARTLLGARSPTELRNYVRAGLSQLRQLRASHSFS